jgi:hypothetical protein
MKLAALSILTALGLGAASARADHVGFGARVIVTAPACVTPAAVPVYAPAGYWREEPVNIWVAGRWDVSHDRFGRLVRTWCPGHYETHHRRVWIEAYAPPRDRQHWDRRWDSNYGGRDYGRR